MNVLLLGGNGIMGPHVVKALEGEHTLRITDVNDLEDSPHEYLKVDSSDLDQVTAAAEGMDVIVNLSVNRPDRQLAFDVNARGCYNVMTAAVEHGIRRVINTGPEFTVLGPNYMRFDYGLTADVPRHPGTMLYALTKSLGQEICQVFTENHDVYVITLLFWGLVDPEKHWEGGTYPFAAAMSDIGEAFACALRVGLQELPSPCEIFTVSVDTPHGKFNHEKTKRILGWRPKDDMERYWEKSPQQA